MPDLAELKGYLAIDKMALDEELESQASLLFKISESLVEAIAERDNLKEDLADTDAELSHLARKTLGRSSERVTGDMVKAWVQTHKDHEKAVNAYLKAKKEADLLNNLKEAFHQRSYMIRDLCSLYVANYYQQTSVKNNRDMDTTEHSMVRNRLATARRQRIKP